MPQNLHPGFRSIAWAPVTQKGCTAKSQALCGEIVLARIVDVVDEPPILRFLGGHEIVAVERALDFLDRASAMLRVERDHALLGLHDVLGMALDVGRLSLEAAERLVHDDARIGKRDAPPR